MNVEIVLNNTVNKTVIEFNYFIHNCLDTSNLANDESDWGVNHEQLIMTEHLSLKLIKVTDTKRRNMLSYTWKHIQYKTIVVWPELI